MRILSLDIDRVFDVGDYAVIDYKGKIAFIACIKYDNKPNTFLVGDYVACGLDYAATMLGYRKSYILTNDSRPSRKTLREISDFLNTDLCTTLNVMPDDFCDNNVDSFVQKMNSLYLEETGVEDEESMAKAFICDRYETVYEYIGLNDYHSEREYNKPIQKEKDYMIGVELEVEFKNNPKLGNFVQKPSNWFMRESDASLNSYGCEIITVPLNPTDAKDAALWETVCSDIRPHAYSWDSPRCGLHVHIGREIFKGFDEEDCIAKMLYLYHHFIKDAGMNTNVFGRSQGYHDHDGTTTITSAVSTLGSVVLRDEDLRTRTKKEVLSKSKDIRNLDINITNDNTIEFRRGKGSINSRRIAAIVEWCELICKYSIRTPWQQISWNDFISYLMVSKISNKLNAYTRL